jgi:hypothetical protein
MTLQSPQLDVPGETCGPGSFARKQSEFEGTEICLFAFSLGISIKNPRVCTAQGFERYWRWAGLLIARIYMVREKNMICRK